MYKTVCNNLYATNITQKKFYPLNTAQAASYWSSKALFDLKDSLLCIDHYNNVFM